MTEDRDDLRAAWQDILDAPDDGDPASGKDQMPTSLEDARHAAWKHAQALRRSLSPSAFGVLTAIEAQLDETALAALTGPERCLIVLTVGEEFSGWSDVIKPAMEALLQTHVIPASVDDHCPWRVLAPRSGKSDGIGGNDAGLADITRAFATSRVVAIRFMDTPGSPSRIADLADVVVPFAGIDSEALAGALHQGFRREDPTDCINDEAGAPSADQSSESLEVRARAAADRLSPFGLQHLQPELIDLACRKAGSIEESEAILARALLFEGQRVEVGRRVGRSTGPTLAELPGYGAVRPWAQQLVDDIRAYAEGGLPWSEVDPGAVLAGPPGTGKTLLASAIAASAGCPFIATSFSAWQSSGDGHLGSTIKAMREAFAVACPHSVAQIKSNAWWAWRLRLRWPA